MNELQAIRRLVEAPVEVALAALTPKIPCFTDNRLYDEDDATSEFCLMRVSFGLMDEPALGPCGNGELIRASTVIEIFTMKGNGPGRGQNAATAVWRAVEAINRGLPRADVPVIRIGAVSGPGFMPLEGRPHFMTRLSFPLKARYDVP
jgi:hypothetical protein